MKRLFNVVDASGKDHFFEKKGEAKTFRNKESQKDSNKLHIALGPDHRLFPRGGKHV